MVHVEFRTDPSQYRHWRLETDGPVATLTMDVDEQGGLVEGYPHDTGGVRKKNSSFLYNGTRRMYEEAGFTFQRAKGLKNCVMVRTVAAA